MKNDPEARAVVDRLWGEFSGSLRSWFVRETRDEHTADDLLQECFLRVHDRVDELLDEERVGAWVRRIARNLLIDWRRQGGRSRSEDSQSVEDVPNEADDDGSLDAIVAGWLAPTIRELSESDRETLVLTELEGLSQRDAAERLGITVAAVKSRVLRGRERLRKKIVACCELEFDRRGGIVAYRRSANCCNT